MSSPNLALEFAPFGMRVLQSLNRRFAPDNNSLEHTAQISAKLCLSSIFSGAQLAPS